jgi:lipopolysaccharide/colanic/teichoic acid biosynthesis glycosyltransferase
MKSTSGLLMTSTPIALVKHDRLYEIAKRVLDVTISLFVLGLLAPFWGLIGILVRLTSPGPALYCVRGVIGKGGREFTVYKFRTMYHNNDDTLHKHAIVRFIDGQPLDYVEKNGVQEAVYKLAHDPRITPFGHLLRKSGLDEIPQFLNVLRGDMTIVGPRPPIRYEYEYYTDYQKQRLAVLPGITGLYQVTARSLVTFEEMVEIDLDYIQHRSFWLDLKIMLITPWVMITGKGAH